MPKFRSIRRKKRRWYGHSKSNDTKTAQQDDQPCTSTDSAKSVDPEQNQSQNETASSRKLGKGKTIDPTVDLGPLSGFRLVDMEVFAEKMVKYAKCPVCLSSCTLEENYNNRKGLASALVLKCTVCEYT